MDRTVAPRAVEPVAITYCGSHEDMHPCTERELAARPVFIVDGKIVPENVWLNGLDARDIESIEIIKSATTASLYGARCSATVTVTTRHGKTR